MPSGNGIATKEERDLLHEMSLRPNGIILRDADSRMVLDGMLFTGWVSDVYELITGGMSAHITPAGREIVKQQKT